MPASRHFARIVLMQSIFQWEFYARQKPLDAYLQANALECNLEQEAIEFCQHIAKAILDHFDEICALITEFAPEWPLEKIAPVSRAVLYIGVCELFFSGLEDVPPLVAIDEAIEISKAYGGENSDKFVNGVISNLYEQKYNS